MSSSVSSFELVIFDCDGVLVDTETASQAVMASLATQWGYPCTPDEAKRLFMGHSLSRCLEILREHLRLPVPDNFLKIYDQQITAFLKNSVQAIPGVAQIVECLTLPKCVASNGRMANMRLSLTTAGLIRHFENTLFSAEQVARPKPAPDLFLFAAQTLDVLPSRCLVIEDSPVGIAGAKSAGMTVWAFAPNAADLSLLRDAGADWVFFAMAELQKKISNL